MGFGFRIQIIPSQNKTSVPIILIKKHVYILNIENIQNGISFYEKKKTPVKRKKKSHFPARRYRKRKTKNGRVRTEV